MCFVFFHFSTGKWSLKRCDNTVPTSHIIYTLLENKELFRQVIKDSFLLDRETEKKFKRRLKCPEQEWELLWLRVRILANLIQYSNISDIRDEAVK